jgi:trehalose-6-phosphate synthase
MEFVSVKHLQDKFDKSSCIVSEFSGCARALGGAFTINPYNIEEISSKIYESIDISSTEKQQRMQ